MLFLHRSAIVGDLPDAPIAHRSERGGDDFIKQFRIEPRNQSHGTIARPGTSRAIETSRQRLSAPALRPTGRADRCGKDAAYLADKRLLTRYGKVDRVLVYERDYSEIAHWSIAKRLQFVADNFSSSRTRRGIARLVERKRPGLA